MTRKQFFTSVLLPFVFITSVFFILIIMGTKAQIKTKDITMHDIKTSFHVPDFEGYTNIIQKKKAFFEFMQPIVEAENEKVLNTRKNIQNFIDLIQRGEPVSPAQIEWLDSIAGKYGIDDFNPKESTDKESLLKRVDIVPIPLALVQAANETAWGTSRFARLGNNMFGQWSFTKGSGIIPKNRDKNATHEVAKFITVNESVSRYIHNLNTGKSYTTFRDLRSEFRKKNKPLDSHVLADGLYYYSSRGDDYIKDIRSMIRQNKKHMGIL